MRRPAARSSLCRARADRRSNSRYIRLCARSTWAGTNPSIAADSQYRRARLAVGEISELPEAGFVPGRRRIPQALADGARIEARLCACLRHARRFAPASQPCSLRCARAFRAGILVARAATSACARIGRRVACPAPLPCKHARVAQVRRWHLGRSARARASSAAAASAIRSSETEARILSGTAISPRTTRTPRAQLTANEGSRSSGAAGTCEPLAPGPARGGRASSLRQLAVCRAVRRIAGHRWVRCAEGAARETPHRPRRPRRSTCSGQRGPAGRRSEGGGIVLLGPPRCMAPVYLHFPG